MQKHPRLDHAAIVFGFVAAALLLSAALFFVYRILPASKDKTKEAETVDIYKALTEGPSTTTPVLDPKIVAKKYEDDVRLLVTQVSSTERGIDELFTDIQNKLLSMRVPQPMLDVHLNAVLALRSLQDNFKQGMEVSRDELIGIVKKLRAALDNK